MHSAQEDCGKHRPGGPDVAEMGAKFATKGKFPLLSKDIPPRYSQFVMNNPPIPTIRDLYPDLNNEDLAAAEANLEQYLALVVRIFERMEAAHGILNSQRDAVSSSMTEAEPST